MMDFLNLMSVVFSTIEKKKKRQRGYLFVSGATLRNERVTMK